MSTDGLEATFLFDLSDVARGVDGNSLSIHNLRKIGEPRGRADLIVRDITVGWLDRSRLPRPPSLVPTRPPLETAITAGTIRLACGEGGGFSVSRVGGLELLVETAVGMDRHVASELLAADTPARGRTQGVQVDRWGPTGYAITAAWPAPGSLSEPWKSRASWSSGRNAGPTRASYRGRALPPPVVPAKRSDQILRGGDHGPGRLGQQPRKPHPVPRIAKERRQRWFGVMAESDWLRLLFGMQTGGDVASSIRRRSPWPRERASISRSASLRSPTADRIGRISTACGAAGGSTGPACACRSFGTSRRRPEARRRKKP